MLPMPSSGKAVLPSANMRKTNLKKRLDVSRLFSRKTPENHGRKKRSTMSADKPLDSQAIGVSEASVKRWCDQGSPVLCRSPYKRLFLEEAFFRGVSL